MKSTPAVAAVTRRVVLALCLCMAAPGVAGAQEKPSEKTKAATTTAKAAPASAAQPAGKTSVVITPTMTPTELARAAFAAQGGEKFRNLKNMMLVGSVDLYAPSSTQSLTGRFGMIVAGEKLRQDVESPLFSFQFIFDGEQSYSSWRAMNLPPLTKFGIHVLARFDQPGYAITALPDTKKERAFRITDVEGNSTDYYVEMATGRVRRFEILYHGKAYSFEYTGFRELNGVLVPTSFAQKLNTAQGDYIAEFKVKEVKLNQDLPADAFKIPEQ
ncbi:MAG: DUF4292 domain-containing protein [Acidobacteria bacterium]|nr:DUF4292 domain-containing protein [Acidobacteriota bacterium]